MPPAPTIRIAHAAGPHPSGPRRLGSLSFFIPPCAPAGELLSAVLDLLPPPPVVVVPADGLPQTQLEVHRRMPSQRVHLGAVEGVAAVVARAVGHPADGILVETQLVQDDAGDLEVRTLVSASHVVHLTRLPLANTKAMPSQWSSA